MYTDAMFILQRLEQNHTQISYLVIPNGHHCFLHEAKKKYADVDYIKNDKQMKKKWSKYTFCMRGNLKLHA